MKIAIVGTGYVGLVTGVCFAELGNFVVCVDNNISKVEMLQTGTPTIYEEGLEDLLKKNVAANRISFTGSLASVVNNADLIFLAVGTPSKDQSGETDISALIGVTKAIAQDINHDAYVVIKSTAPVGTVDKMKDAFYSVTKSLDKDGINIFVSSNPEFLKEGTAIYDFMHPDRIVIGTEDAESEDRLSELYAPFEEDKHVKVLYTDVASAQIIKYASNAFNATKISFINSISRYCAAVGGDISDVAEGMGLDSRIGRAFLNAGIGYGGSCFPKDIASLKYEISKKSIESGSYDNAELLSSISDENFKAWWWVVELIRSMRINKQIPDNATIAILGLAFKPNTDDVRYSPALNIISELSYYNKIRTFDPIATENARVALAAKEDENESLIMNNITFCDSLYDAVSGADVTVLCTEWPEFKKIEPLVANKILTLMKGDIFIDGRNALNREQMSQIFDYYCVGKPHISKK